MKKVLVTGSAGLIGSEAVRFYIKQGFKVCGIDNNMRKYFFGEEASTDWNRKLLENQYKDYKHYDVDIRNQKTIEEIFSENKFDLIIHAAAQPSHDWAAKEPLTDFSVNATGTLILLEAFRKHCPEAVFIFTSTNKVYGDTPNKLPLVELETRYEIDPNHRFKEGIDETMSLDNSKHSIFGASKVAADIMVQEYGKYFDLKTGTFRGGCLTGPAHSGTKLHGFLAYLAKCVAEGKLYTIFGYKGKQVRDNIHSADMISAIHEFYKAPRCGEVYNMGGSRHSNVSMMEAIEKIENFFGRKGNINYTDQNREGDHMWYVSDVGKFKKHYPTWEYTYDIDDVIKEICTLGHFSPPKVGAVVVSKMYAEGTRASIFVASHVTEEYGPVQALKYYLIKRSPRFLFVEHPFSYSNVSRSQLGYFRGSLMAREKTLGKFDNEGFSYIRDFILTIYWYLREGRGSETFIGVDSLNALVGVLLKMFGVKFRLIYYSVDYTTERFKSKFLSRLYQVLDKICVRKADFVWNSSERIRKLRSDHIPQERNLLVPNGVYKNKFVVKDISSRNRDTIVVVGHLSEGKGLEMLIEAFAGIKKVNPKAKLVIIGSGPLESKLKDKASRSAFSEHIIFKGNLRPDVYLDELGNFGVGICLREGGEGSSAYYADPISCKEFLACGLPIIVSKNLWISEDVKKKGMGLVVGHDKKEIVTSLRKLWEDDKLYNSCAGNALKYMEGFSWEEVFDSAFGKVL